MILIENMDFRVLPWVYSTELHNLVSSLEYFVSNGRQVLLGGIRLGGSVTEVVVEDWYSDDELLTQYVSD